jgi:glycine betaine catabolism B
MNPIHAKSTAHWMNRLFKQCDISRAVFQQKTFFAHRYHEDASIQVQHPFYALFNGCGSSSLKQETEQSGFQRFIEPVRVLPQVNRSISEACLTSDSNAFIEADNASVSVNSTALCALFVILNCFDETPDTKTFRLGLPDGQRFEYLPGQYITISVEIKGEEYKRSYSLASSPSRPGRLELTIKRDPNGGVVSNWLIDNLNVGDTLKLKGPFGKFSLAKSMPAKILFLAAGSGIVPIMSMLRWIIDTDACVDVILMVSFRSLSDIIYHDELNLIAARHKNIKLYITLTKLSFDPSQWLGLMGRFNEKIICDCVQDMSDRTVYLCGPDSFMTENKQLLQRLGLPERQLYCESFYVKSFDRSKQTNTQYDNIARPFRNRTGNFRVSFAKSGKTIIADGSITLLEIAETSGIAIDHECRAGNCGECMIKCMRGSIEMTNQAEMDPLDRKNGWVYACCAYPVSNVVLDA